MSLSRAVWPVLSLLLLLEGPSALAQQPGDGSAPVPETTKQFIVGGWLGYLSATRNTWELMDVKLDYGLEALIADQSAWMDYRSWQEYPGAWQDLADNVAAAHAVGLSEGTMYGLHFMDCADALPGDACGFSYYYGIMTGFDRWRQPDGTLGADPYSPAVTRSFSGKYVVYATNQEFGRQDVNAVMQPQSPDWRDFVVQWGMHHIDAGADSIFLDNPIADFAPFWNGGWGCSDTWEGRGFIERLKARFTDEQLEGLGVANAETFCMKDYITAKYGATAESGNPLLVHGLFPSTNDGEPVSLAQPAGLMDDPLVMEYVRYWYSSLNGFAEYVGSGLSNYAASQGKDVLLIYNANSAWSPDIQQGVTPITLAPFFDQPYLELEKNALPPWTDIGLCKTGLAMTGFDAPPWIGSLFFSSDNPFGLPRLPDDVSGYLRMKVGEAFSSGCVMPVPFGTGEPQSGDSPTRMTGGIERTKLAPYYQFLGGNKQLFQNVASAAKVAVAYSIPTVVWNFLPTLGILPNAYKGETGGWARAMELLHVPYDIVLLGMEDVWDSSALGAQLQRYDTVFAPSVTHVSPSDLAALQLFVQRGGKLVTTSDFATRDALNGVAGPPQRTAILSNPNTTTVVPGDGLALQQAVDQQSIDLAALGRLSSVITAATPASARIVTNAPNTIFVSPQLQQNPSRLLVHLVNYDYGYDQAGDWVNPAKNLTFSIPLPAGFQVSSAQLLSPDGIPTQGFQWAVNGSAIQLQVPEVGYWSIVVCDGQ